MSADDLRRQYEDAIRAHCPMGLTLHGVLDALLAARDEELARLRYERRLLGAARMVLDLVATGDSSRWEQARREAEDLAQRIVDEIGHPVTDEPALGPGYRAEIARLQALQEDAEQRAENAEAANAQAREGLAAALDAWGPGHRYLSEHYRAAIKAVAKALAALPGPATVSKEQTGREQLLALIRDLADPDPCWFDHHGGCQAHGYLSLEAGERCPHAVAKELLRADDAASEEQTGGGNG